MEVIELKDYLLLPVVLMIIFLIATGKRNNRYALNNPLRKYYLPALGLKILGAVSLGLVYQYYYNGGDTLLYHLNSKLVADYAYTDPRTFFDLVFKPISSTIDVRKQIQWNGDNFAFDESNFFPVRIIAVLQLLTFNSYLPCAAIFAAISFTGVWKLYVTFVHMYPDLYKKFAIAFLFMPSVIFWGSGVLKDSICIGGLGWLFYGSYQLFILRRKPLTSTIIVLLSGSLLLTVKIYIALAFLPSLLFWIFFTYRSKIRIEFLRVIFLPLVVLMVLAMGAFAVQYIAANSNRFILQNIVSSAATFNENNQVGARSAINIGVSANMSTSQLFLIAPLAIITTIFRPFLWEARTAFMALSSLEGAYIIYLFLLLLFRTGLVMVFKTIIRNPLVAFCLIFSLVFAFAIGFSTSNFGTLVRYKIPCIPFFLAAIFIMLGKAETKNRRQQKMTAVQSSEQ
jgi:hypothetical protein